MERISPIGHNSFHFLFLETTIFRYYLCTVGLDKPRISGTTGAPQWSKF